MACVRWGVLLLASLAFVGCGSHGRAKLTKIASFPGSVVEADGHKVYFDCEGTGSPTVMFLSGLGSESADWLQAFEATERRTRTCQYDRGGVGVTAAYADDLPRRGRDANDQVRELEQLIRNARIPKPFVLVGHSWGGALARLYAGTHDDVRAVVFIDSSTPGQDAALAAAVPPKRPDEPAVLDQLRTAPPSDPLLSPEYLAWRKSLEEVGAVRGLGDLPIVVITAGNDFGDATRVVFPTWLRLQNGLARLSSRSIHVIATTSSHFVQLDEPALTEDAIRAAIRAARADGRLGSCAAIFASVTAKRCISR